MELILKYILWNAISKKYTILYQNKQMDFFNF